MSHAKLMRQKMIDGQIMPLAMDVESLRIAFQEIPRELFVMASHASLAYSEAYIPRFDSHFLVPAPLLARMLNALSIQKNDTVLVIGGGGYSALILKYLGGDITYVDHASPCLEATQKWAEENSIVGLNIEAVEGSLTTYVPTKTYDVILVDGAVADPLPLLPRALAYEGRLLTPLIKDFSRDSDLPHVAITLTRRYEEDFHEDVAFTALMPVLEKGRC